MIAHVGKYEHMSAPSPTLKVNPFEGVELDNLQAAFSGFAEAAASAAAALSAMRSAMADSLDTAHPDTSQPYFLDLIRRIDAVEAGAALGRCST